MALVIIGYGQNSVLNNLFIEVVPKSVVHVINTLYSPIVVDVPVIMPVSSFIVNPSGNPSAVHFVNVTGAVFILSIWYAIGLNEIFAILSHL